MRTPIMMNNKSDGKNFSYGSAFVILIFRMKCEVGEGFLDCLMFLFICPSTVHHIGTITSCHYIYSSLIADKHHTINVETLNGGE